jgi:hypothetical protein
VKNNMRERSDAVCGLEREGVTDSARGEKLGKLLELHTENGLHGGRKLCRN